MKNTFIIILILLTSLHLPGQISELKNPKLSPFQKTEIKLGVIDVSLEYSRPSMRGRKIFGALVPYDQIWRTGANKNTKIVLSDYVRIGGIELEAGTYTIFSKPSVDSWDIYFHTEIDEYGVPEDFNPDNSVARINVPTIKLDRKIETLSITFAELTTNSASLIISWENIEVYVPIEIPTDKILQNYFHNTYLQLAYEYSVSANIYFENNECEKALEAINKSISLVENDSSFEEWLKNINLKNRNLPYRYYLKSKILNDLGRQEESIKSAEKSLLIAERINSEFYIKTNKENIENWHKN
ncbi:DUF2911 domain-containing protein [Aquimarina sp. U1-2]|uniref:DUF2911 domain-containing protein n=1 Tax=Aquimarina sp. U1-2 TaxID=2823141 RepID=UPI001AEC7ABF|nr:DUF2911 domain-containing protein [Aquimarina sp. U1-2]MBP2833047.1 DUF2911 domain-containing protein [Aquimarina sp. U1-2]